MNDIEQLDYIRNQLTYIKTKVELDNQLGLQDINKLCEDIFMHILNDVYGWNLKNANLFHENFPAIDLIDDVNKTVIQVTSTTTADKLRSTIEKFKKLSEYSDYQLKIFYIKDKPNFQKSTLSEFARDGVSENDLLGIDNILKEVQADQSKCLTLYKTIQQRMDNISFKFNIDSYFEKVEPHLIDFTNNKFKEYEPLFKEFIESETKVLEIYAVGGSGKSHLLQYLSKIETEYIPLIFTKQINIEEDLKKLDPSKKYLFIFDDIDRFLDQPIFLSLLSYTLNHENIKLAITYRTPSRNIIKSFYRKYTQVNTTQLEIVWSEVEIKSLIKSIKDDFGDDKITQIAHVFNNNPYLITQAFKGNIETVKGFSKKIIDDTKKGLAEFELSESEIQSLLFRLSLITPISERSIEEYFNPKIIKALEKSKILRKLASKYRFNPDILGDLYLANYVDESQSDFEERIEELLPVFSDNLFTNLSYALQYNQSDSLQNFIKHIIQRWSHEKEYRNDYLALVNKVVYHAPEESFIYLQNATKYLKPKQINAIGMDGVMNQLATKYSPQDGDWSSDKNAINLESIEPIISKLVYALKNDIDCGNLTIEHIINYLSSDIVLNLRKAYYDNQTLESIFKQIVSPLNTKNFDVILNVLDSLDQWQSETPINLRKINLLAEIVQSLLGATFEERKWEAMSLRFGRTSLNLDHGGVLSIIGKAKEILFSMLNSDNEQILLVGLGLIRNIGGHDLDSLSQKYQDFYNEIKKEVLQTCVEILDKEQTFHIIANIEDIFLDILRFSPIKDEALSALRKIARTGKYIFYRLVKGSDIVIIDFQVFNDECKHQVDIREWIYQNQMHKIGEPTPTESEWELLGELANSFKTTKDIVALLNDLETGHYESYNLLLRIFDRWYEQNTPLFNEVAIAHIKAIENKLVQNALKEFSLTHGLLDINVDEINKSTSIEDLRVYLNSIFNAYNSDKFDILKKIVEVVSNKDEEIIRMFIAIISQRIYSTIDEDNGLYYEFESILARFLKWQHEYSFSNESYITHHILYNISKKHNLEISTEIIDILKKIVENDNISTNEFELKSIYKILDYGLDEIVDNIYKKSISKKENGEYKHFFTHYFDYNKITEVLLIKSYINSYDDFIQLLNRALLYCRTPVEIVTDEQGKEHELNIHLDYFFKYAIHKEYIEQYFEELYMKKDITTIKLLYKIVPVSSEYIETITKNLNLLDQIVDEDELVNYLRELGKIKMYSGGNMQNSPELLAEEAVLENILEHIESLPLQLKIKDELKYVGIRKREEIESDISHLLEK